MHRLTLSASLILAATTLVAGLLLAQLDDSSPEIAVVGARTGDEGWTRLWDGKTLDGWQHLGPGGFTIESGLLKSHGGMGLLWYTKRKFGTGDTIRVVFKTEKPDSNSGIFIRFPDAPKDPWYPIHFGYEVQIDNSDDDWHCTGVIYSMSKAKARPQKAPGEWNTMDITLRGDETVVWVNGILITDFHDRPLAAGTPPRKEWYEGVRGPRAENGYMGVQNEGEESGVFFREVSYRHNAN
jgi:hypothetical protein